MELTKMIGYSVYSMSKFRLFVKTHELYIQKIVYVILHFPS